MVKDGLNLNLAAHAPELRIFGERQHIGRQPNKKMVRDIEVDRVLGIALRVMPLDVDYLKAFVDDARAHQP